MAHGAFDNDLDLLAAVRQLYSYLPLSNRQLPPSYPCPDPIDRPCPALEHIVPDSPEASTPTLLWCWPAPALMLVWCRPGAALGTRLWCRPWCCCVSPPAPPPAPRFLPTLPTPPPPPLTSTPATSPPLRIQYAAASHALAVRCRHPLQKPYDMHDVVAHVVDDGHLFEIQPDYAQNVLVGPARLGGTAQPGPEPPLPPPGQCT